MLSRIELHNFKAFKKTNLELGKLTLLTGLNASGKSSVLHALALLRQSADASMSIPADTDGEWLLNGPLVSLGTVGDLVYEWAEEETIRVILHSSSGRISIEANVSDRDADTLRLDQTTDCAWNTPFAGVFNYLRADRIAPEPLYPRSHQAVVRDRCVGSRGEFTAHFLAHFRDESVSNSALHLDGSTGLLTQTTKWMEKISPGLRIEPNAIEGTDFVGLRFGFGASSGYSGSASYRPTHVGFGLTYALPIVVAALGSPPGSVLLVENPEAHVHPSGQSALGQFLARAAAGGLQVIVESHSDHFLNGIRLAVKDSLIHRDATWVHYFERTSPREVRWTSPVIEKDGRLSRWPRGFFDQWERDLDRLLERET